MDMLLFGPELYFLLVALVLFCLSLKRQPHPRAVNTIAATLAGIGVLVALVCLFQRGDLFFQAYRVDLFSQIFKFALALGLFLVFMISRNLAGIEERLHPEFYLFLTTCTLGMMMLVSSVELLTIYVSLELSSYSLYILVPLRRGDDIDVEAGIKYLFIGAVSSGFMLFGLSYIFGATHSTYLVDIIPRMPQLLASPIGGASAGYSFAQTLVILSIVSMTLGNLVAIIQKDLKRMLAYSSIAHAGYILMGVLAFSEAGYASAVYYALAYLIMNFTVFMVLNEVATDGRDLKIAELAGLYHRSPLLTLSLILGIFALAGVPPSIGFTGKLLLFTSAMNQGYFFLVLIGAVNGTISLYYYLKVVYAAYFLSGEGLPPIRLSWPTRLLNYGLCVSIIGFGVFPNFIVELARTAVRAVL